MAFSFFPNLIPRNVNPSWFQADRPCDEENELTQAEQEHQIFLNQIATMDCDIPPIGKTSSEPVEEEEDEEEDEEHEDDESSRDEAEDSDIDVDSFTANNGPPNFNNREMGGETPAVPPARIGNITMDLSE